VTLELELPASDFDGNNSKMKHKGSQTYLGTWDGERRGIEGDRCRQGSSGRRCCASGEKARGGAGWRGELGASFYRVEVEAEGATEAVGCAPAVGRH
jgi:hypothetical protein